MSGTKKAHNDDASSPLATSAAQPAQEAFHFRAFLTEYRTVFAASTASLCSVLAGSPFDSIKVRMQTSDYRSTLDCVRATWNAEGLRGFYRGIIPPLITVNIVKTISVSVYENSRSKLFSFYNINSASGNLPSAMSLYFLAGGISGISTSLLSCPLELIRIQRFLLDNHVLAAKTKTCSDINPMLKKANSLEYAKVLLKTRGIRGLYKGYSAHLLRESLGTAMYWCFYETFNRLASPTGRRADAPAWVHASAGGLTGMFAWIFIFPIDLVKSTFQKEATYVVPKYKCMMDVVRQIYKKAGIGGFYNGITPTMLRAFPIHSLNFLIYERMLKILDRNALTNYG